MIPRAASATRALLRLTPCYQAYRHSELVEISGTPGSLELTGECFRKTTNFRSHVASGFPALRELHSSLVILTNRALE